MGIAPPYSKNSSQARKNEKKWKDLEKWKKKKTILLENINM